MGDLSLFLPEALVLLAAVVAFLMSAFGASYRTAWGWTLLAAIAALVATGFGLFYEGQPFFDGIYRIDLFSQLLKLGIVLGLVLTLFVSQDLPSVRTSVRADMPVFLTFSTLGMMLLVSATELLTLFVALELSAYALYIMSALHRNQREGSEASAKYLLFGAAASAVTLYGLALLFGTTGSTRLTDIAVADPSPIFIVGIVMALSGLFFKLAIWPFHGWAPDAYQGAPHQAATFIGTTSKVAAVGVLVRVLALAVGADDLTNALMVVAVLSMTLGNLAALVQKDLKRILAYSTIAHAGYILMGLLTLSELGMASAIFYGLIYLLVAFCAFLVVCGLGQDGENPTLDSLAGLYKRAPLLGVVLLVGMFGLAGIPPTPGFAGKWFLFSAAMDKGLFWLVFIGAVNATVSLYYYLRIVKEAYLTPPGERAIPELSATTTFAAYATMALVAVIGFYPGPVWDLAQRAARSVLGG